MTLVDDLTEKLMAEKDRADRLTAENNRLRDALDAKWQDIKTVPAMERVFVAGWQEPSASVVGYWWYYEDVTGADRIPMDHPDALIWMAMPKPPSEPPRTGEQP